MTPAKNHKLTRPRHVLAVTDFSDAADEALRQAHGYARMTGADLTVLHAVADVLPVSPLLPQGSAQRIDEQLDLETQALDGLTARVQDVIGLAAHDVKLAVRTGKADVAAVRYAEENDVDVIVVGATGRTGLARLLLGSNAERVVRYAHCSVLVARPSPPSNHVLAATDLSDVTLPAIERAKIEAEWRSTKLHLTHAIDLTALGWAAAATPFGAVSLRIPPTQIAEMRALAEQTLRDLGGPDAVVHVAESSAKKHIVALAEALPASLVIVGTHGRTGLVRMALGSVAEAIVRAAPCSVLVVRSSTPKRSRVTTGNFDE